MAEETVVLGREECFAHGRGNLLISDRYAALLADLRDQLPAARVNAQGHRKFDIAHIRARGQ